MHAMIMLHVAKPTIASPTNTTDATWLAFSKNTRTEASTTMMETAKENHTHGDEARMRFERDAIAMSIPLTNSPAYCGFKKYEPGPNAMYAAANDATASATNQRVPNRFHAYAHNGNARDSCISMAKNQ